MTTRETERLVLRPLAAADFNDYIEIHENPQVLSRLVHFTPRTLRARLWRTAALAAGYWYLRGGLLRETVVPTPPPERAAAWKTMALLAGHWRLRGYGQWTVIEKATGQIIGRVGLWNPEGWPGLEVGWVIRTSRWNCGFATEAARAAIRCAFDEVGADHVISIIRPDNAASIRVATKIGETFEREQVLDGQVAHIYGIRRG